MTVLINIDVPDAEIGVRFYVAAFGREIGRRLGNDFAELLGWEAPVYLLTKKAGTVGAGGDLRRYERHWTPFHLDIVVDDVDAAVARAVDAGATLEAPAEGHSLRTHRHAGRPIRPRLLSAAVHAQGYDALLDEGS